MPRKKARVKCEGEEILGRSRIVPLNKSEDYASQTEEFLLAYMGKKCII